jgi:3-keto-5-aminohexanoate cleavage enzyme
MPSWDPDVAEAVVDAIRAACPGVIINLTTGVIGKDISGPAGLHPPRQARNRRLQRRQPELPEDQGRRQLGLAADGVRQPGGQGPAVPGRDGRMRHAPRVRVLRRRHRALVGMYLKAGMLKPGMGTPEYNFVMGVASGMPCDADLLALLPRWMAPGSVWQATLIGRAEIWPVHQKPPPNSAACCAPAWKTPSTCPTAAAPAATAC